MQAELTALLSSNHVPATTLVHMTTIGCTTMKAFANWIEQKSEMQNAILDGDAAQRTSRSALAALKQSWREAEALVARGVKRGSEGLDEETIDSALPHHVQAQLETAFSAKYSWALQPRWRGCDSLLGRLKREADKWAPSMFSAGRVRSLAYVARTGDVKKHRVTDRFSLLDNDTDHIEDLTSQDRLRTKFMQY